MAQLGLVSFLQQCGLDTTRRVKLVRHRDQRFDLEDFRCRGWLEFYQAGQSKPKFDDCELIISFMGTEGTRARFVGIYRVLGRQSQKNVPLPAGYPDPDTPAYFYDLKKEPGYELLENRLVIDWGKGALAWVQRFSDKEVVELLPKGQIRPPFQDYLEFTLSHRELVELCRHSGANRDWQSRLSAVAGIYLILATDTGNQYVGSAYGSEGIWGRWSSYAKNAHGGNVKMKQLLDNPAYPDAFTYSILQILPRTMTQKDVLKKEAEYKKKLGSRATGINCN